jgi:hypothetical protein
MDNKLYELFQSTRLSPKKTAKHIYDLAIEYSVKNKDYDISISRAEDHTEHDGIILSFLTVIDKNLNDSNITTKYLSNVVDHLSNYDRKTDRTSIDSEENVNCFESDNFYVSLAIKYLRELYITSENISDRVECHEKAIGNIHKILIEKDVLEKEQKSLINELNYNLSVTKKSTSRKSKKIIEISSKLKAKDEIDNMQSELIEKLDRNLIEKEQVDNMQSELIDDLRSEIEKKSSLDDYQSELIDKMQLNLIKKDSVDKKQSMLLLKLRESLIEKELMDLEQSQSIYKLETIITNHQTQIDLLAKKITFLDKFTIKNDLKFGSVCVKIYLLFALCIIFNILTVLYFSLSN